MHTLSVPSYCQTLLLSRAYLFTSGELVGDGDYYTEVSCSELFNKHFLMSRVVVGFPKRLTDFSRPKPRQAALSLSLENACDPTMAAISSSGRRLVN